MARPISRREAQDLIRGITATIRSYKNTLIKVFLFCAGAAGSSPAGLVPPTSSNVFALGDADILASNIAGSLTAGGNGTVRGGNIGGVSTQGDLNVTAANIGGGVSFGGSLTSAAGNIGSVRRVEACPLDFAATARSLEAASTFYGSLAANGTVAADPFGNLTLTGTDPGLNVFHIPTPTFNASVNLVVPAGSTALINLDDPSVFLNLVNLNGLPGQPGSYEPTHVLFNFPNTTDLVLYSDNIWGTILAPLADVTTRGFAEHGTLIAGRLSATASDFADQPFGDGSPLFAPPTGAVPEPSGATLLIEGALGLAGLHRAGRRGRGRDRIGRS